MTSPRRRDPRPYWLEREQAFSAKLDRILALPKPPTASTRAKTFGPCAKCFEELIRPVQTVRAKDRMYHLACWRLIKAQRQTKPPSLARADATLEGLAVTSPQRLPETIHTSRLGGQQGANTAHPPLMAAGTPAATLGGPSWPASGAPQSPSV